MSAENLKMEDAIDFVLKNAAGDPLEVLGFEKKSTSVSFQSRKVEQFSFSESRVLGVRLLNGRHEGLAYTESLEKPALFEMVNEARENARMIEKDYESELQGAARLPKMDSLFNPALEEIEVERKIEKAGLLESVALDFDPAIKAIAYNGYQDVSARTWIATSKGLRGDYRQNRCFGYTYCLAQDGENTVMAGDEKSERDFENLNAEAVARTAAEKALKRRGAFRPDTGRYHTVFENRAAQTLIGMIASYFSAKSVDDGTSPLRGKLGQKIFSPRLTLIDDPFHLEASGSRPFDDEGFASQTTPLIDDGVVRNFLTNSVLAKKMKLAHTASAARSPSSDLSVSSSNLIVKPGTDTFEKMTSAASKVIVITKAMGMSGFRATSGDFSIPFEGELYVNGKREGALKDFMVSGNIFQLLTSIEGVADDALPPTGGIICPSLLIRDLNVVGKS